jgi:hypothetical protein
MKKELFGTTALISAGLLAGSGVGQEAQAADPLSLAVGGYSSVSIEYRNEDDSTGEPGANLQTVGVYFDGEIQFTATTTLDNGISVKARTEYEAFNQSGANGAGAPGGGADDDADEHYIEFGGVFGQIRVGADDDAAYAMQYQAPVGAYQIGVNTTTFAVPSVGGNAITSYPTTYIAATGDAEKIIWFSPRIAGFQLGVSYAPTSQAMENTTHFPGLPLPDNTIGAQENIVSIGANFVESFNDIDVAVAAGYNTGSLQANSAGVFDDIEMWSAGLNVGFAGFTVGGSVANTNNGLSGSNDTTTWDAGVTYSTGPFTVGFTYLGATSDASAGGSDDLESFNVSGTYNIGPGVDLWGGVKYFDYQDGAGNAANENEGYIVAIGSSVSF